MADENENKLDMDATGELEAAEDASNMVLTDDDGTEVEFEYIGSVDYKGDEYVVLLPVENDEDAEAEVLILKVEAALDEDGQETEEEQYVSVDSEDVLNEVFAIFKRDNADMFEFVEE